MWESIADDIGGEVHIIPVNDICDHRKCITCLYDTRLEVLEDGILMVTYNAYDQRK